MKKRSGGENRSGPSSPENSAMPEEPASPKVSFQEFVGSSALSHTLLAGLAVHVGQDGLPRKRTLEAWREAAQTFAHMTS